MLKLRIEFLNGIGIAFDCHFFTQDLHTINCREITTIFLIDLMKGADLFGHHYSDEKAKASI